MPFKKVNCRENLEKAIQDDPSLIKHVEEFKQEYTLIKSIVTARKNLGLTQKDVAIRSGLTQQMISRIENIDNSPSLSNFIKYVDALGLKLSVTPKV